MWPKSDNIEDYIDNISKDISCFANTNSLNILENNAFSYEFTWKERQVEKKAVATFTKNELKITYNDTISGYKDFLASPYMADLHHAAQQFLSLVSKCEYSIPAMGTIGDEKHSKSLNALLNEELQKPSLSRGKFIDYTKLFFIRGQAGVGKTVAMKELVRENSELFLKGKIDFLFLYIDAQGRALVRLDEALAQEITDYSLVFQPKAVQALVRNNLIYPIIDGFDELIGAGGFADAFKSLSSFLASLACNGSVIATGRSVFYDENVLKFAADRYSQDDSINYALTTITVQDWTLENIKDFIHLRMNHRHETSQIDRIISSIERELYHNKNHFLFKPFYLSKWLDIYENESSLKDCSISESQFVHSLIQQYIKREVDKFKNRQGIPVLNEDGHEYFLQQLALELWWQERRTIDNDTIEAISQIALENFRVSAEDWPIFIGKAKSYAFLMPHENGEKAFESPLYYDALLSDVLFEILNEDSFNYAEQFFSRSLLSESALTYFSEKASILDINTRLELLIRILGINNHGVSGGLSRQNLGALFAAVAYKTTITDTQVANIEIYGAHIDEFSATNTQFINCFMKDIKWINTSFLNCTFHKCSIINLILYGKNNLSSTRFDQNSRINKLITQGEVITNWKDIKNYLKQLGAEFENQYEEITITDKQKNLLDVLELFLAKAKNRYQFDINPDLEYGFSNVFSNDLWDDLAHILLSSGVLREVRKDRQGPRQVLYRLNESPNDILSAIYSSETSDRNAINSFVQMFRKFG